MQNVLNPLVTMYQTQLEASRRFADAVFSGTEKLDRVMIGATHRAINDQLRFAQALANLRDPRNVGATLQAGFLNRSPEEAASYQKELMQIFSEMQNDIGRSFQECLAQFNGAQQNVEEPAAAQEHATDAVFNPVSSMFTVWESAFKEVAELAKKNMMAAQSSVDQATANSRYASATATGAAQRGIDEVEGTVSSAAGAMKNAASDVSGEDRRGGGGKRK